MDAADLGCYELNDRPQISSKSQSCADKVALFSAVLRMVAIGFHEDPKLGVRSGILDKKSLQCSFAQPVRISIDVVSSAIAMGSLR